MDVDSGVQREQSVEQREPVHRGVQLAAAELLVMQALRADSSEHGQMEPVGETPPQQNPWPSLSGEGDLDLVGGPEEEAQEAQRASFPDEAALANPRAARSSLEDLQQYTSSVSSPDQTSTANEDHFALVMENENTSLERDEGLAGSSVDIQ